MRVEAPVLDGDHGLGEMGRHVGRREFLALEGTARGEDPSVIRLHREGALAAFRRHPAERRQGRETVEDEASDEDDAGGRGLRGQRRGRAVAADGRASRIVASVQPERSLPRAECPRRSSARRRRVR